MRGRNNHGARRRIEVLLGLLVAALAVLLGAAPASAHDYLVGSDPTAGSTVRTAITKVQLTFDAAVLSTDNGATVLSVVGPGGKHFETACPVVQNDDLTAAVRLGGPGTYTATWRIVSSDGHPVSASIRFRYAPPAGTVAAPGTASGPACGSVVRPGTEASTPTSSSSSGVVVLIAVVVGVLVVLVVGVAVVAVVATRRRP